MNTHSVRKWNYEKRKFEVMEVTLEEVITNIKSGYYFADIGLALFNEARKQRGLSQFFLNEDTGTYDEIKNTGGLDPDRVSGAV